MTSRLSGPDKAIAAIPGGAGPVRTVVRVIMAVIPLELRENFYKPGTDR